MIKIKIHVISMVNVKVKMQAKVKVRIKIKAIIVPEKVHCQSTDIGYDPIQCQGSGEEQGLRHDLNNKTRGLKM